MSEKINNSANGDVASADKNFAVDSGAGENLDWYDIKQAPFKIYGLMRSVDDSYFIRLPEDIAKATSDGVAWLNKNTAGGRVRFSTDSPRIVLKVTYDPRTRFVHMPATGVRGFDLYTDTAAESVYTRTFVPEVGEESRKGYTSAVGELPAKMTSYTINFPLYNNVSEVLLGFEPGSRVEKGIEYPFSKPIIYYGSSITQGGCASRPGNCFTSVASRALNMDHVNLGFSGSGKGETVMMEYIASLDMDVFVYDYDHNAPSPAHLAQTHERGYRIIREKHPDVPIVILSKPDWTFYEIDCTERRNVIMRTYSKAIAEGDTNVFFVDGRSHFAACRDRYACTVDGCHPNDLGMYYMANSVINAVKSLI
ncbi:MAG: SGNH/GDSL hydrolase family protein [Clostridia bacterium]|nr:SGNH/GDSL hydrolase family protein [Clostridia bacterium]